MRPSSKSTRWFVIGFAIVEAAPQLGERGSDDCQPDTLFALAFFMVNWDNHLERLLFVLAVLSYTIIALGLVALGAHVTRSVGRVLAVMSTPEPRP